MKSNLLSFILFLLTTYSFGQINFQKGYFIDNNNQKTECLIKNIDWKNNPIDFIYKLEESGIPENRNISSVKEFGIYGISKYIRSNVKIDRSREDIEHLSEDRLPVWSQETLFLKVLIEGKASLHYFEDGGLKRFFYSVSDTTINQLIYKKYLIDYEKLYDAGTITKVQYDRKRQNNMVVSKATNNTFRQQLWKEVGYENATVQSMDKIDYNLNDLEKYFTSYNRFSGDNVVETKKVSNQSSYKLNITPGLNITTISLSNVMSKSWDLNFKTNIGYRLGLESEFVLPFNKNKWAIIIEPTFEYFKSSMERETDSPKITYTAVEFPIGIRYYGFLNKDLKIFFNGFYISTISPTFNSNVYQDYESTLDIAPKGNYAVGGGFEYKNLSFEVRYHTNRGLLSKYSLWSTDYSRISFIVGYTIFKNRK